MRKSTSLMRLFSTAAIAGIIFSTDAMAQKIIWVSSNYDVDQDSVQNDQPFVDVLTTNGYEVQREIDSMKGTLLTAEQMDVLESADLIIFSRSTGSGDYNDPAGWNAITKPMILNNVYAARLSKWQWAGTEDLLGGGDSGCPPFYAEIPEHPIFAGVTLDADGTVIVLDNTVGTGNTSLLNTGDYGDGELIASAVSTETVAIVYWETDALFNSAGAYFAGGPRLLFPCQTREGGAFGIGMYNLTPEGEKMYLNAVAFMLGNSVGVSGKPSTVPAGYSLEQNHPNPFNPSTRIAFTLPSSSVTKISVYNSLGQEISVLAEKTFPAGTHEVVWNGCDRFGNPMPGGVYLYQMKAEERIQTRKMLLIQ
ncbi:T9SS type A sorting domain-containing protein [bacterium]|nr:T9SS type A sorting domain-containing protein [bacterium]